MTNDKIELTGDALTPENIDAAIKIISKDLNLYQKIIEVKKIAGGFYKDTRGFGFEYVSGNQILSKIRDKMNELNLILQPAVDLGQYVNYQYKNAKGQEKIDFVVWGKMSYTWINGDKPEERERIEWAYYGQQDDISKAFGSGLTYSERYFLLKALGLPTDEDEPDAKGTDKEGYKGKGKQPQQPQNKPQQPQNKPPQNKPPKLAAHTDITPIPETTTEQKPELSKAQIQRLYTIGTLATFTEFQIKTQVQKRFNKTVSELTKSEYDLICKGYQAVIDKNKEQQEQQQEKPEQ